VSTATTPPRTPTLKIQPWIDAGLSDWVDANSGPGAIFSSPGHAAQLAVGRLKDELDYLAAQCKAQRLRFDWNAAKRAYADVLGEHVPTPQGRPRAGVVAVARRRRGLFVNRDILRWIDEVTEKHGFFHAAEPVPHAIESGLRLLRSAETDSPVRTARFPFDGAARWKAYADAAKAPR
jgi:hypothetical protein